MKPKNCYLVWNAPPDPSTGIQMPYERGAHHGPEEKETQSRQSST